MQPNCASRIIEFEGSKRIVIFAQRDIAVSEELTYDYKAWDALWSHAVMFRQFPLEDVKIPCYCGAKHCRGTMN